MSILASLLRPLEPEAPPGPDYFTKPVIDPYPCSKCRAMTDFKCLTCKTYICGPCREANQWCMASVNWKRTVFR